MNRETATEIARAVCIAVFAIVAGLFLASIVAVFIHAVRDTGKYFGL